MKLAFWRKTKEESTVVKALKLSDVEQWQEMFGGGQTFAGPLVNSDTAMRSTAVYACVRLIAGTIGMLPVKVYRRTPDGRETDTVHPLYSTLHQSPNPMMTATVFWEALTTSALLPGNGYALIGRNRNGDPMDLTWIHPRRVAPEQKGGRLVYRIQFDDNSFATLDQDDILHIPAVGWDGTRGMSPIAWAGRQAIGLALAAEEHSARFFGQGATPNFALEYPKPLGKEQADQLRDYWQRKMAGLTNAHTPAILTEGGQAKQLTMNAEDAQLIESRQFQVVDIARIFGVPPHMVGETTKSTSWGSGIEHQNMGFVTYTLGPWLRKIEQEVNRKLFRGDNGTHFCEFSVSALLRGDSKTRHETYNISRGGTQSPAYMTINEIRKLENLPPIDGGDELYRPPEPNGGTNAPEPTEQPQQPTEQPPHGPPAPAFPG